MVLKQFKKNPNFAHKSSTELGEYFYLGKDSKTRVTGIVRKGGGVPPLSANFFPLVFRPLGGGGGGTPPLR